MIMIHLIYLKHMIKDYEFDSFIDCDLKTCVEASSDGWWIHAMDDET